MTILLLLFYLLIKKLLSFEQKLKITLQFLMFLKFGIDEFDSVGD